MTNADDMLTADLYKQTEQRRQQTTIADRALLNARLVALATLHLCKYILKHLIDYKKTERSFTLSKLINLRIYYILF